MTFVRCPILWVSKLQTEIALSTLHAEYVALSQCLRDLLPVKEFVIELLEDMGLNSGKLKFNSKSTVFEDNNGAIRVATCPKLTPTSKFIAVNITGLDSMWSLGRFTSLRWNPASSWLTSSPRAYKEKSFWPLESCCVDGESIFVGIICY